MIKTAEVMHPDVRLTRSLTGIEIDGEMLPVTKLHVLDSCRSVFEAGSRILAYDRASGWWAEVNVQYDLVDVTAFEISGHRLPCREKR